MRSTLVQGNLLAIGSWFKGKEPLEARFNVTDDRFLLKHLGMILDPGKRSKSFGSKISQEDASDRWWPHGDKGWKEPPWFTRSLSELAHEFHSRSRRVKADQAYFNIRRLGRVTHTKRQGLHDIHLSALVCATFQPYRIFSSSSLPEAEHTLILGEPLNLSLKGPGGIECALWLSEKQRGKFRNTRRWWRE